MNSTEILDVGEYEEIKNGDKMKGYEIKTTEGSIIATISEERNCCETWGKAIYYFVNAEKKIETEYIEYNNEQLSAQEYFVGSKITNIKLDEDNKEIKFVKVAQQIHTEQYYDIAPTYTFVLSVYTDKGKIIIIMYNDHNGYYPHWYHYKYKFKCVDDGIIENSGFDRL